MINGDLFFLDSQLAVVPIVVNAGAALLPAILAGIASFVAILFKPKELLRMCQTQPWIPVLVLAIGVGITALIWFWPAPPHVETTTRNRGSHVAPTASAGAVQIDWTKIALARIAAQKQTPTQSAPTPAPMEAVPTPTSTETSFIFRGGPQRLGSVGADLTEGTLVKSWHYYPRWIDESGIEQEDTEAMILSSPAYHKNRVYGASCLLDPPDNYGAIFCLDAVTGQQIWSVSQINGEDIKGFFSSPAVTADGRYLLIGQGLHPDSHCNLICIETETGQVHWTLPVSLHIESSPAIDGDMVYVGCGAIEDPATHKALSHTGYVLAVRISDGQEQWRYDVIDPESSPVVENNVLYIGSGFNGKAVVALDTTPGSQERLLWKRDTPYPITGAVTLLGDTVIAGGGNGDFVYRDPNPAGLVLALDKKTGEIQWQQAMPDAVLGAVAADTLLICPVASGQVMALDLSNGERRWDQAISGNAPVLAACAVTDTSVYAVSQDGYLGRLNIRDGSLLDKQYINDVQRPGAQGLSISSPFIAHGRLYVGSETGGLRCYHGGGQ